MIEEKINKEQNDTSKNYIFPKGFFWGASTSSHQVEGNNKNDWSEWEKKNADKLAKEAKNQWGDLQAQKFPGMLQKENYISGKAAGHYFSYEKDFDIAKSLGHNAHRLSIEWSRIEPEEGKFNEEEIKHYKMVLIALKERGIEPFVTLWHWTLPLWVSEKGGFENKETIKFFARYVKKMSDVFSNDISFWITLNEPEVFASHAYLKGNWPPQKTKYLAYRKVIRNLVSAHKEAYNIIKDKNKNAKICVAKHNIYFEAVKNRFLNKVLKRIADAWWNDWFLKKISGYQDIISLNNYHYKSINFGHKKNKTKEVSDMGWELDPKALSLVARELKKYNLPIYVTEHGLADADDSRREWFLRESLKYLCEAIEDGADVRGYLYWSLLDNFEWDKGFWPRFGLLEVNYETMERKIRKSALKYAKICKSNIIQI